MSTSYYAVNPAMVCGECDRPHEGHTLKIGTSAIGWTFLFKSYEGGPETFREWLDYVSQEGVVIFDEYDREMSHDKFREFVARKQKQGRHSDIGSDYYRVDPDGYEFCARLA